MTFKTYYNSKSVELVRTIATTEDLQISYKLTSDALGDAVLEVTGNKEDIRILKEIYNTVSSCSTR